MDDTTAASQEGRSSGEVPESGPGGPSTGSLVRQLVGREIAEVERALIEETLLRCGGNRTRAAELLGISVRTIHNKLRRWRPDPPPGEP